MRTNVINLLIALLFCFNQAGTSNAKIIRHIDRLIGTEMIKVTKIEYSASATTLTFRTTNDCGPTLKIGHGIYIVDDQGVRHHAISTEGIKLDSLYILPKGEKRRFSVSFEPVAESNQALDVICPDQFSIMGVHNQKQPLNIPKATCRNAEELFSQKSFTPGYVEIDGRVHDANKNGYETIYANYIHMVASLPKRKNEKYAKIEEDGTFHLRFYIEAPQRIVLMQSENTLNVFGYVFVMPGEKISLDIYDWGEGKELNAMKADNNMAFNRLNNCPGLITFPYAKFQNNTRSLFKEMTYNEHISQLEACYEKSKDYADYICWHYNLNEYESYLYREQVVQRYVSFMIAANKGVLKASLEAETQEEREMFKAIADNLDLSYLRQLNPDGMPSSYLYNFHFQAVANLNPFTKYLEAMPGEVDNRWLAAIEAQEKELKTITGCNDNSFMMQGIIVEGYHNAYHNKPASETEFQLVRRKITHPYWKQYLDAEHAKMTRR